MYVNPDRNREAGNLRWILSYCKPDWPRVAGSVLLFCVNDTTALIIPLLSGAIVDQVITGGKRGLLVPLCLLMIGLTVIRVFSRYGYQMWMERFGQNTIFRLVSDEYEKLHELDFTYFNHTRNGDIMSRMTSDTDAIRHGLAWASYQILDCVVMFVGALAVMFAIDWRLALALAAVTPPLLMLTRALASHAHPLYFAIRNSLADLNSRVEENIEGNRVVQAFVREDYETQVFDKHNDDYMQKNMALAYNSRKYMPWLDGLGFGLELVTLGLGGWLVIRGEMTLGDLVVFNSFLWMIEWPVRRSGWLVNDWQRFNASCIKIRKLLTARSRIVDSAVTPSSAVSAEPLMRGEVQFDHVSFAFPDEPEAPVLSDLNFTLPAGSKLGILGETGSGKSTLVNLIARFYDPAEGRVLIDGKDVRDWPLKTLRSKVSIVAQDTFLFSDTIGNNIGFGAGLMIEGPASTSMSAPVSAPTSAGDSQQNPRSEAAGEFIRRMAQIAGADNFIESMPEGYDTVVGERGVGLSGGQKQRLSLARSLADNPSILIMDDTTSAVDMETESRIQESLRKLEGSRTIVTIAHRISSIKDADLILVLEHGSIVERGSHEQLVALHGRYWEIYRRQLGLQAGNSQGFEREEDR